MRHQQLMGIGGARDHGEILDHVVRKLWPQGRVGDVRGAGVESINACLRDGDRVIHPLAGVGPADIIALDGQAVPDIHVAGAVFGVVSFVRPFRNCPN